MNNNKEMKGNSNFAAKSAMSSVAMDKSKKYNTIDASNI